MIKLNLDFCGRPIKLMFIGAHSDDIEIGCGGTILQWLLTYKNVEVTWVVFSAAQERAIEAKNSANIFSHGAGQINLVLYEFDDGYFPSHFMNIKTRFEYLKSVENPDIVFTHYLYDRHQDHQLISELTWQTFRDHLIFEYEIPKYEGDLSQPNLFVQLTKDVARRKIDNLMHCFGSQRAKSWFKETTFSALMQLRAIECRADSGFAEAFYVRKMQLF